MKTVRITKHVPLTGMAGDPVAQGGTTSSQTVNVADLSSALGPIGGALLGAIIGTVTVPKGSMTGGAVAGGLMGIVGQYIGRSIFRPTLLTYATAALGGYIGGRVVEGFAPRSSRSSGRKRFDEMF